MPQKNNCEYFKNCEAIIRDSIFVFPFLPSFDGSKNGIENPDIPKSMDDCKWYEIIYNSNKKYFEYKIIVDSIPLVLGNDYGTKRILCNIEINKKSVFSTKSINMRTESILGRKILLVRWNRI